MKMSKIKPFLLLAAISFILVAANFGGNKNLVLGSDNNSNSNIFNNPAVAGNHDPILIDGNAALATFISNEGLSGDGLSYETSYIIEDFVIDNSAVSGIEIQNTDAFLIIRNCTVLNSGTINEEYAGFYINSCSNIKIMNCTSDNNERAIGLSDSSFDNIVINNTILHTNSFGICLNGHHNEILNNTLINNDIAAFNLWQAENNLITGNIMIGNNGGLQVEHSNSNNISDNEISDSTGGDGISLSFSNENNISKNTFLDGSAGISLWDSNNTIISENSISETHDNGIQIFNSINNLLFHNTISDTDANGILLENSPNNDIQRNIVSNSGFDNIQLINSTDSLISENFVSYSDYGICFRSSDICEISNNTIIHNNIGIYLFSSDINSIYYNDIYGNNAQSSEDENSADNHWYYGTIGNYWGDYTARYPDATNDGTVWNTPYEIDGMGLGIDHFPLVNSIDAPQFTDVPQDFSADEGYTGLNITWIAEDLHPATYTIELNGSEVVVATAWTSGIVIMYDIPDGLLEGDHNITIIISDESGNTSQNTVIFTVNNGKIHGYNLLTFGLIISCTASIIIVSIRKRRNSRIG